MSRKDFRLIALTIAMLQVPAKTRALVAREFAFAFKHSQPSFDEERFLLACTVVQFGEGS
jgi:hypothetical protein